MQLRDALFPAHVLRETFSYPDTKQMTLTGPILDLRVWALENNQDYYEIRELNPWIRGHVLPE